MSKSNYQAEIMFNMNSRRFINALEGITEEQANHRFSDHNNSIIWLGTHLCGQDIMHVQCWVNL